MGLSVTLMGSVYFRFVRGKVQPERLRTTAVSPRPAQPLPKIDLKNLRIANNPQSGPDDPLMRTIRDIFKPLASSLTDLGPLGLAGPAQEDTALPAKPDATATFQLKGTIVGGKIPMALIDDQFVRPGDEIHGCKVVHIGKKTVLLDSGDKKFTLELMKND